MCPAHPRLQPDFEWPHSWARWRQWEQRLNGLRLQMMMHWLSLDRCPTPLWWSRQNGQIHYAQLRSEREHKPSSFLGTLTFQCWFFQFGALWQQSLFKNQSRAFRSPTSSVSVMAAQWLNLREFLTSMWHPSPCPSSTCRCLLFSQVRLTSAAMTSRAFQENNQTTIMMSLAQGNYCDDMHMDPASPLCARIILSGYFVEARSHH